MANARGPEGERFPLPTSELERMAESTLRAARAGGATAAETEVSQAVGQSVTVRNGEVETISYNRDKGISVTVFIGQRRGHASTADFAPDAIEATVAKALAIARYTARDPRPAWPTPIDSRDPFPISISFIRGICRRRRDHDGTRSRGSGACGRPPTREHRGVERRAR
jgi:hypothetical protein